MNFPSNSTAGWRSPLYRSAIVLALLGLACGGKDSNPVAPGAPSLSSLALTVMGTVEAGQPIDLKIEAVGTDGSRPYTAFNGPVTLTTDRGTVTPTEVALAAGAATTTIELSVADGAVGLTASTGSVVGNATINLTALSILPGAPGDPVETAIPDIAFEPRGGDYHTDHPDIPGIPISFNTMGIVFELGTTVGEANAILTNLGATIAGGIPGVLGQAPGILMIRTNSASHATMTQHLQQLEADALVKVATEDWMSATQEQPKPNGGTPSDWNWEVTPTGGNWGLELARMPAVWNINKSIERNLVSSISMGIIDNGMTAHPDFPPFVDLTPTQVEDHGIHVAGIMGASYDNALGVDGVNPYSEFVTMSEDTLTILWQTYALHQIMRQSPGTKVVNISLGIDWGSGTTNPGTNAGAQQRTSAKGALCEVALFTLRSKGKAPLICVAAGNESNSGLGLVDAIYSGGWANAALEWLTPEILVVENVERNSGSPGGATRRASSNIGGHISAPGTDILSTVQGGYGVKGGTSMATPFIAGVIGYLYALDSNFTQDDIKNLLLDTAVPVGGGAADRVDAAAAVLNIDTIQGPDEILRRFVDIDDGTTDGNLRAQPTDPTRDFVDEDADGNGGPGDGQIDMSDFRRWRDWLLQAEDVTFWELDGSQRHLKRDVNGNGTVETPSDENVWPRADYNLDGILSRTAKSKMPGAMGDVEATDLEVLQNLFSDPDVDKADLRGLIESADIHVALGSFLGQQGVVKARIMVVDGITEAPIVERIVISGGGDPVITVATGLSRYAVKVEGLDSIDDVICTYETDFELAPGKDIYLAPECTSVVVEATMPQFIEVGTPSPLSIRAGIKDGSGMVVYQAGLKIDITATGSSVSPSSGATRTGGVFDSEITLNQDTEQTTVFVTATDTTTGQSATTSASAQAVYPAAPVKFLGSDLSVTASADAASDHQGDSQRDTGVQAFSGEVSVAANFACETDPSVYASASANASQSFAVILGSSTNYLQSIILRGSAGIAIDQTDNTGCDAMRSGARGVTNSEVEFRVLDEAALFDLEIDFSFQNTEFTVIIDLIETDTLGQNRRTLLELDFGDTEHSPGAVSIVESVELLPNKLYLFSMQVEVAESISFVPVSFTTGFTYEGTARLRKPPPAKMNSGWARSLDQ